MVLQGPGRIPEVAQAAQLTDLAVHVAHGQRHACEHALALGCSRIDQGASFGPKDVVVEHHHIESGRGDDGADHRRIETVRPERRHQAPLAQTFQPLEQLFIQFRRRRTVQLDQPQVFEAKPAQAGLHTGGDGGG